MIGKKIIDGLRDLLAGNFARVTVVSRTTVNGRPATEAEEKALNELMDGMSEALDGMGRAMDKFGKSVK